MPLNVVDREIAGNNVTDSRHVVLDSTRRMVEPTRCTCLEEKILLMLVFLAHNHKYDKSAILF